MTSSKIISLPQDFFNRDTVTVAQELLGHELILNSDNSPQGIKPQRFKIVETEAYTQNDPACHAYKKTTGRAANLYQAPGLAYVYLIYGMYHCLNVITEPEGTAGAVLFRAIEPLTTNPESSLKTHGPGRLTRALNITKDQHNGINLSQSHSPLFLAYGKQKLNSSPIIQTTRIGISKAKDYPWRFYIKDNPYVSVL